MPESVTEIPGSYFFECDLCQEACPWNRKHLNNPIRTEIDSTFSSKDSLTELFRFETLLNMDEGTYREKILPLFTGVELSYELFRRNVNLAYRYRHKQQI